MRGCIYAGSVDLGPIPRPTYSMAELPVNQAISEFKIQFVSKEPWICTASVRQVSADGILLPEYGSRFDTGSNPNVEKLKVVYFVPENFDYCSLMLRGYR